MRRGQIVKFSVLVILLVIVLIAGTKAAGLYSEYKNDKTVEGTDVEVTIEKGAGKKEVAKLLKEKKLIKHEYAFVLRANDSEYGSQIKYGTFTLNTGMNIEDMLKVMSGAGSQSDAVKIVVPEGYSVEMIANRIQEAGLCSAEEFLTAAEADYDYWFLESIPADADVKCRLQGFLFPATYEFYQGDDPAYMVEQMLAAFDRYFTQDLREKAEASDYTMYEIVNMASIVEREAAVDEERPTIAGVLFNRLAIDMKLQMCPTVLYPITDGLYNVGQVLYKDLEIDSPYNTYKYPGLPVGPICNPGVKAIEAVLEPESHEYKFYHTVDETSGTHIFTKTYEEHEDSRIKK